jgi:uncharacterized protein
MRIAVIGSGISGLGAAYLLARAHEVHVFERDGRPGGHANTVIHDGLSLDTGFLVHNVPNYPLFTRLLRELDVATHESDMTFSVSCSGCGLEYSGRRPFARPANAANPGFLSLLWEIGRWLRTARPEDEAQSLAEYLDAHAYSQRFRRHFLVPLTSALWSTAPCRALEFPAAYAIRFFDNHGMLGFGRFRWRTVTGGSHSYVDAIARGLGDRLRLGQGVRGVRRSGDAVDLRVGDRVEQFDRLVLATHADQALALLEDPTPEERRVLGGFAYTTNEAFLHTDSRFLPRTRAARASWNYRLGHDGRPTITYHLNRLQALDTDRDYCLTLNDPVPEEHLLQRFTYEHPLYTVATLKAQSELPRLTGGRTHYAGAYFGNGFHEDGLASGVAVARALGVEW